MATRRMFSLRITDQAAFLRMPASARLLYYDLGMHGDDDGFVEAFTVLRMTGASEDDLHALSEKGFVRVLNDDLLTWVVDWTENNLIRSDRYRESLHHALLAGLTGGMPEDNPTTTACQPDDNLVDVERETQVRLGQVYSGKVIQGEGVETPAPFTPPTIEDVDEYLKMIDCPSISAQTFVSYYQARGWLVGNVPMVDWKASVRSWASRENSTILSSEKLNPATQNYATRGYTDEEYGDGFFIDLAAENAKIAEKKARKQAASG